MAVNKITNKQVVSKANINRANVVSTKGTTIRGNRETSIIPGNNLSDNYSITLKDVDTAVLNHVKNIMKPIVKEANETLKIPVYYGNEERWKSIKTRGALRDKNGSILLPIMVIKRTSVGFDDNMPMSFDNDLQGKFISTIRSSSGWSKNNRYDRFSVLTGQQPVQEFVKTGMPDFVTCSYSIVMMTSYIEQMNDLNSVWLEHLETYFGDQTSHRFLSSLDGDISNEIEMESQGERMIKNEFTMTIKGYVMPEFTDNILGKTAEMQRGYTPKKVSFSEKII